MSIVSEIRDVIELVRDGQLDRDTIVSLSKKVNWKQNSLSHLSTNGMAYFPVLMSRSIDIDTAQIITKSLERNYVSFLQIVTSMNPIYDLKNGEFSQTQYIRQFHTNSLNAEVELPISAIHDIATDNLNNIKALSEALVPIRKIMNKDSINLMEGLNLTSVNDVYNPKKIKYGIRTEAVLVRDTNGKTTDLMSGNRDYSSQFTKVLQDSDIKKSNELMPTMMNIRVEVIDSGGSSSSTTHVATIDFNMGVKATMIPINSQDMVINVAECYKNNSKAFKFIRWATGEIKFMKDLIFNITDTKSDIMSERSKTKSPWWSHLSRLKRQASYFKFSGSGISIMPNTTLVLNREEADLIKVKYGYDVTDPVAANSIINNYFLLGFVIVDTSVQAADFLFAGKGDFERVSFSGLEKENSASERKFKEMLKAVNRI